MQPRPQAITQEIKTALMGMLRVGETCTGLGVLFGGGMEKWTGWEVMEGGVDRELTYDTQAE